jgi:hypothetical protein
VHQEVRVVLAEINVGIGGLHGVAAEFSLAVAMESSRP